VIIGVREGYREDAVVAMRIGCAEVAGAVENVWKALFAAKFGAFEEGQCGNLLFHVEQSLPLRHKSYVPRGTLRRGSLGGGCWIECSGLRWWAEM